MLDIADLKLAYAKMVEHRMIPACGCAAMSLNGIGWVLPTTFPWYWELLTPETMRQGIYHANDNQF